MAFRKKSHVIEIEKPDILIVPECENPEKLSTFDLKPTNVLWYGHNRNKGLAIFSFGEYKIESISGHNTELKLVCPISVSGGKVDFTLFAIWANNPQDKEFQYVGQVWKAILYYENLLNDGNVIIAGDFNSNVIWDKLHRKASHSMLVEKLETMQIYSAYHKYFNQEQGKETHPTYYMYRHENKPYHIDYCFASSFFMEKLTAVRVGTYNEWTMHSDHKPLFVDFDC